MLLSQTSRQAYGMQQLQEELERYKELVATLETSISRKDQLITSLNTSIEKQVNSPCQSVYLFAGVSPHHLLPPSYPWTPQSYEMKCTYPLIQVSQKLMQNVHF